MVGHSRRLTMAIFKLKKDVHWNNGMNPTVMNLNKELSRWLFDMNVKWYLQGKNIIINDIDSASLFKLAWMV